MADQAKLTIVLQDEGPSPSPAELEQAAGWSPSAPAGDIFAGIVEPPDDASLEADDAYRSQIMDNFLEEVIQATDALGGFREGLESPASAPRDRDTPEKSEKVESLLNMVQSVVNGAGLRNSRAVSMFTGAMSRVANYLGPYGVAIGAATVGLGIAAKVVTTFYNSMERASQTLAKWDYGLAAATATAEVIGIGAERRRAGVLGDELATYTNAKARTGSALSDIGAMIAEPFYDVGAQLLDTLVTLIEIVKPALEIMWELSPIRHAAELVAAVLKTINKVLKEVRDWLMGAENGQEKVPEGLRQLREFVDAAMNAGGNAGGAIPPAAAF